MASFAKTGDIPEVKFAKDHRKEDEMAPYLKGRRRSAGGRWRRSGWRSSSSECKNAYRRESSTAAPQFTVARLTGE